MIASAFQSHAQPNHRKHGGHSDDECASNETTALGGPAACDNEGAFFDCDVAVVEQDQLSELPLTPQCFAGLAQAMPLAGGQFEPAFDLTTFGGFFEPALQRVPAADQCFVRDFIGERFPGVAGDDESAFDQGFGGCMGRWIYQDLFLGSARARPFQRHQHHQDATGGSALIGGQAHQHLIGMAGQGAGDTADFRERVLGDDVAFAGFPQLGQCKLQQRQSAVGFGGALGQLIDHRRGFKAHPFGMGWSDDRFANFVAGHRAQNVERPRQFIAEAGHRRDPRQKVTAHRGEHPNAGRPRTQSPERRAKGLHFMFVGQRHKLFELIDENQHTCLVAELFAQLPSQTGRLVAQLFHQLVARRLHKRRKQLAQRHERIAARHHQQHRPRPAIAERSVGDEWQYARAAERRLADARISSDEDERFGAQSIDDRADFVCATEKQGSVLGFKCEQAAVGISFGGADFAFTRSQRFERFAQIVARCKSSARVALEAAINDFGKAGVNRRRNPQQRRCILFRRDPGQLRQRHFDVWRCAGAQLIQQGTHRVNVRLSRDGLAAPNLRRHVQRRSGDP